MIDIRDYDIAITERIKTFYKNTHWIMRTSIPIQEIRDRKLLNGEDIEFPLITVRRTNCPIFSKEYNSWSRAKSGQTYYTAGLRSPDNNLNMIDPELAEKVTSNGHKDAVSVVNSTFDLTYYIDVISLERDNFDTLVVELQENLFRIPYLGFDNLKSDGEVDKLIKDQACHLFVEEIEDTSDLDNFDNGNALYRATITVKLNAYIYRKYRSATVDSFNITSNVIPGYLSSLNFANIDEYITSDYALEQIKSFGYSSLLEYVLSLGYTSVDEFLNAVKSGKAIFKLAPDSFVLEFKIPSKVDSHD